MFQRKTCFFVRTYFLFSSFSKYLLWCLKKAFHFVNLMLIFTLKKVLPLLPCVMGNLKDSLFVCLKKINKAKTHNQCISVKIMPELIGVMASCLSPSAFTYLDLDAGWVLSCSIKHTWPPCCYIHERAFKPLKARWCMNRWDLSHKVEWGGVDTEILKF